jgi:hypothetical protein
VHPKYVLVIPSYTHGCANFTFSSRDALHERKKVFTPFSSSSFKTSFKEDKDVLCNKTPSFSAVTTSEDFPPKALPTMDDDGT